VVTAAAKRAGRQPRTAAGPTRSVILDTAERLFAARGLEGVAVRDLARDMGITASSLYNHFPGKRALYDAVLERGLGPILETVAAAWQDGLHPDRVHATLDRLTAHLARHPHLARLLQRALLEESPAVEALLGRWVAPLFEEGIAVVRKAARNAGWAADEVPYLGVALFGMIFASFINARALRRLTGWSDEVFSERTLAVQRRFLEQAVLRLLGPRPRGNGRRIRRSRHG
jgi:AcrR family transcriptional regulator